MLFALMQFVFSACALITLTRLDKRDPEPEAKAPLGDELDTYFNDIPTEETDE
jgi:hypothetical protein